MKNPILTLVATTFLVAGGALAQSPPADKAVIPTRSIHLTAEQSHTIKEVVKDMQVRQAGKLTVAIGDKAPADIALESFPQLAIEKVPQLKTYKFFIADGQIVIVDSN
ncbi:MAG: hypothetical protein HY543_00675, partial [Deltaproteobacteria bacterium]|nr:hypothetical protein [Deltaproteobacteria bacterium]